MDLYTLGTLDFRKREIIDDFVSVIWTERFRKAGEVQLTVEATPEMINKLSKGTYLALHGSDEVMILETHSIEKGLLTVSGESLLGFFKHRPFRVNLKQDERHWYVWGLSPGGHMQNLVSKMVIGDTAAGPGVVNGVVTGLSTNDKIPNVAFGLIDVSAPDVSIAIPYGTLYDALLGIAETYQVGQSLYLDHADESGYLLKYTVYLGDDHTSGQTVNDIVRFSPTMDSLVNVKELSSIAGYKNVCYAFAPNDPLGNPIHSPGIAYAYPEAADLSGFSRRTLMIFVEDITTDQVSGSWTTLESLLNERARNALANNNFTKLVDGEVVPNKYQFGVDYKLGDYVELQGYSGYTQKARISEYVRTQDESGERAYPTVEIVE